jgi:uncharacterized RDD family membrane protein YckC
MATTYRYDTFAKRLLAGIVDGIIFMPLSILVKELDHSDNTNTFISVAFIYVVCRLLYTVIGHGKYGQTIGKRVMNIKVFDLQEQHVIGYKKAFARDSVWFIAEITGLVYLMVAGYEVVPGDKITDNYLTSFVRITIGSWFLLELISMFFNDKRRAIHDYLAGSVVIDLNEMHMEDLQKRKQAMMGSLHKTSPQPSPKGEGERNLFAKAFHNK